MERILVIFLSHHFTQEMDPITENVGDHREAKFPVFQPEDQERELWGAKAQRKSGGGAGEKSKSVHAVLSILPSYNNGGSTAKALRIRLCVDYHPGHHTWGLNRTKMLRTKLELDPQPTQGSLNLIRLTAKTK